MQRNRYRLIGLGTAAQLAALTSITLHAADARAISGGAVANESHGFAVKLAIGSGTDPIRSCSGALVQPLWVVTAASCFQNGSEPLTAGPPAQETTATVGRTDLSSSTGQVARVVQLVPAPGGRNLVLAKLSSRIEGVTPVKVASAAPAAGERLLVAGYGRTASEWVPQHLQVGSFSVQNVAATTLSLASGSALAVNTCRGDSGGPTLREHGGALELVAITTSSWQSGCLGETDARSGATQTRVDDLAGWIAQHTNRHHRYGSLESATAVTCNCWDRDCWGRFCSGGACAAQNSCTRASTTYDIKTGDFDADGKADLLTLSPNANGAWAQSAALELTRDGRFESAQWPLGTAGHMRNGGAGAYYRTVQGDFDGDGTTDLATITPNGGGGWAEWIALELAKAGRFESQVWSAKTPLYMRMSPSSAYIITAGDFNGDGKTDLATLSPDGTSGWVERIALELAQDGGGFASQLWNAGTPVHMHNGGANAYFVLPGDFNGDGKTDLATISPNAGGGWTEWIALELGQGAGFSSQLWPSTTPRHMRNGGSTATYHVIAADFTGDGRTDIATLSPNAAGGWGEWISVDVAKASGGFESQVWPAATPGHMRSGVASANYRVLAGDVNGDGRADLMATSSTAVGGWSEWVSVELSTSQGFSHAAWTTPTPQHMRNGDGLRDYRVLAADLDGNDMTDLAVISPTGGGGWQGAISVDRSSGTGFSSAFWSAASPGLMRSGAQ